MPEGGDDRTSGGPLNGKDPLKDLAEAEAICEDMPHAETADRRKRLEHLKQEASEWTSARYFHVFRGVACSIAAELDLRSLVKHILQTSVETLGAERGVLFLGGVSGAALIPVLAVNVEGDELESIERVSRTILQHAQRGEVVVTADAMVDSRFADVPSIRVKQIRSVLCAPLLSQGEPLGVLYLDALSISGAFPWDGSRFLEAIAGIAAVALRNARLHGDLRLAKSGLEGQASAPAAIEQLLIGVSPAIRDLRQKAALAAQIGGPVLVLAESGSKPALFAQAVASARPQPVKHFEICGCAACPRDLEAELLFGHASRRKPQRASGKPGLVQKVRGGVLLLEEVSALDPRTQSKLARMLRDGTYRQVGASQELRADVQLIAATTRDLPSEVRRGRFNGKLYARLSAFEVRIPPLRERREDVPLLVQHFAAKHAWLRSTGRPLEFTPEALVYLQGLPLPGNDLELERLVQDISVRAARAKIGLRDLQRLAPTLAGATMISDQASATLPASVLAGFRTLAEIEREVIHETLVQTNGNKSAAARLLGLQRNTLLRKMKRFRL